MFATFNKSMISRTTNDASVKGSNKTPKQKRSQVARACDWCRTNRIRCDDQKPCKNCSNRKAPCSNGGPRESARNGQLANKEVQRLKSRITELEEKFRLTNNLPLTPVSKRSTESVAAEDDQQVPKYHWVGIWYEDPHTKRKEYYGPGSTLYFSERLRRHLAKIDRLPKHVEALQPVIARDALVYLSSTSNRNEPSPISTPIQDHQAEEDLTRQQEEYLIGLFWQSYHSTTPILNDNDFRSHYQSLWEPQSPATIKRSRRSSPLVDIVLALCLQYGTGYTLPKKEGIGGGSIDASTRGRWVYSRAQHLMAIDKETPSISTLQCHIFSTIYLMNASFRNIAHETLAIAARTAHVLGLHHELPRETPHDTVALWRRIWWSLIVLDTELCVELGRPYIINLAESNTELPEDDLTEAALIGSNIPAPYNDISLFSFHTQTVKLMLAARSVYSGFSARYRNVLTLHKSSSIESDPAVLETCAAILHKMTGPLQTWADNVPTSLKLCRKAGEGSFSTERSPLAIDIYVPLWLQRQRVILELLYHGIMMALLRPFIRMPLLETRSDSVEISTSTPISDGHGLSALNHATTITRIVHQILSETDILNSWHQAYQMQWDSTLTMLAFAFMHPICPFTPSACKTLTTSIDVFDIFSGYNSSAAKNSAAMARDLSDILNDVIDLFRGSFNNEGGEKDKRPSSPSSNFAITVQNSSNKSVSADGLNMSNINVAGPAQASPAQGHPLHTATASGSDMPQQSQNAYQLQHLQHQAAFAIPSSTSMPAADLWSTLNAYPSSNRVDVGDIDAYFATTGSEYSEDTFTKSCEAWLQNNGDGLDMELL